MVSAMRSDESTLLAAIIQSPSEPAPRLAYADWLQSRHETDRARWIRLMVLGPSGVAIVGTPNELLDRRSELQAIQTAGLAASLAAAPPELRHHFRHIEHYDRGLLGKVVGSGPQLEPVLDRLLQLAPITEVDVTAGAKQCLHHPGLRQIRVLTLRYDNWLEEPWRLVETLRNSPNFDTLRKLRVESVRFCDSKWTGESDTYLDQLTRAEWEILRQHFGSDVLVDARVNEIGERLTPLKTARTDDMVR
jgi:uncharacterized protein (TIGR02996 family)